MARELPDSYTPDEIAKMMTPEFQETYAKYYQDALDSGMMDGDWDTEHALDYFKKNIEDDELFETMKKRLTMQADLGNNQHFLGNGLTKTLLPNNGNYGAVETFNIERRLVNLEQFGDANNVSDILEPIGN